MKKAIFFKEWIKTRWYLLAALVVFVSYTLYLILRVGNAIEFKGAAHLWAILLTRDVIFIEPIQYVPMIFGLLLGVVQFVPEVVQKRLKLTLHLPFPQSGMVLYMMLFGLGALTIVTVTQIAALWIFLQQYMAAELIAHILLSSLPWYAAGYAAYLMTYAVCIEPSWRMRSLIILTGIGLLRIHFLLDVPQSYNSFIVPLFLFDLAALLLILRSMVRFKEGCQD